MAIRLISKQKGLFKGTPIMGQVRVALFGADFQKLEMPALSPTMTEGTIVKWNLKEGDKIEVGDVLCEIQTDKATVGFESQEEGYLAKILSADGSKSAVGNLIGIMVDEKEDIGDIDMS